MPPLDKPFPHSQMYDMSNHSCASHIRVQWGMVSQHPNVLFFQVFSSWLHADPSHGIYAVVSDHQR